MSFVESVHLLPQLSDGVLTGCIPLLMFLVLLLLLSLFGGGGGGGNEGLDEGAIAGLRYIFCIFYSLIIIFFLVYVFSAFIEFMISFYIFFSYLSMHLFCHIISIQNKNKRENIDEYKYERCKDYCLHRDVTTSASSRLPIRVSVYLV